MSGLRSHASFVITPPAAVRHDGATRRRHDEKPGILRFDEYLAELPASGRQLDCESDPESTSNNNSSHLLVPSGSLPQSHRA
jgi:hypothetical protein